MGVRDQGATRDPILTNPVGFIYIGPMQRSVLRTDVELDVTPLSGTIGAVIHGLDLRDLDDATVAAVRQVWLKGDGWSSSPTRTSTRTATRPSPPGSAS